MHGFIFATFAFFVMEQTVVILFCTFSTINTPEMRVLRYTLAAVVGKRRKWNIINAKTTI